MPFTSSCPEIIVSLDQTVLVLKLNRPDKKNALTGAMYQTLVEMLEQATPDPQVRAVIITGSKACFTAGNDIQDFLAGGAINADHPTIRFLYGIAEFPKPMLAAVSGPAVGIGTTMLLHCDLAYADPDTVFQLPFTNLGLCPEAGSSYLLPRLAGYPKAAELLLLGNPFDAGQALKAGIINGVAENPLAVALDQARRIAGQPPAAVRLTKKLLRAGIASNVKRTMTAELEHFGKRLQSAEAREAFTAFLEKRAPDFSGFE